MGTRVSSMSGLFDLVSTVGMSVVQGMLYDGESQIFTAANEYWNAASCGLTANALGRLIHYTINYEVPDEFYVDMLQFSLSDHMME